MRVLSVKHSLYNDICVNKHSHNPNLPFIALLRKLSKEASSGKSNMPYKLDRWPVVLLTGAVPCFPLSRVLTKYCAYRPSLSFNKGIFMALCSGMFNVIVGIMFQFF